MARTYTVPFTAVSVSAAQDLWEVTPTAGKAVKVLGLVIGQYSDVGDAASENGATWSNAAVLDTDGRYRYGQFGNLLSGRIGLCYGMETIPGRARY